MAIVTAQAARIYVYIDGESHYIRSDQCWKSIHGQEAELSDAWRFDIVFDQFRNPSAGPNLVKLDCDPDAKFFWDKWATALVSVTLGGGWVRPEWRRAY